MRFPSFWAYIDDLIYSGGIRAAFEVKGELKLQREEEDKKTPKRKKEDDIYRWFANRKREEFFVRRTADTVKYSECSYAIIRKFGNQLIRATATRPVADPYVIALAMAGNCTVVTQENPMGKKTRIPHVCAYYKIPCIDLYKFVKEQENLHI